MMALNEPGLMGHEKFEDLRALTSVLNQVSDLDVMMETILSEARRFVGAEAGSIYIREGDRLIFSYNQNDYFAKNDSAKEISGYKNQEIPLNGNSLAAYVGREGQPLNLADAYGVDLDSPYRFNSEFDRKTGYVTRSILTLPLNNIRRETIGVLQIINRLGPDGRPRAFEPGDEELMIIFSSIAAMALERVQLLRQMTLRFVKMAELHDPMETVLHAQRVAALAAMIYDRWARERPLEPSEVKKNSDRLRMAAMLHDVGNVGISDQILNKPTRLNPEERQEMQKHVLIGLKLFEPISSDLDLMIHEVILNHHERWDGRGYPGWVNLETGLALPGRHGEGGRPMGKKGQEISIFGRVTAVADVFDALTSRRVYKDAFDEDVTCQIMMQESGHHFDPELVDILLLNLDQARALRKRFPEL